MRTLTADSSSGSGVLFEMNAEYPYEPEVVAATAEPNPVLEV